MAYALQAMLKIRAMKEDQAQASLALARGARQQAEVELQKKAEDLINYEAGKDERRDRVFATVMGKVVQMDTLDRVRSAVASIDEEGVLLAEAERKAQENVKHKEELVEQARLSFVVASKNREKIVQHRALWEEEERKELERIADNEMDEFAGRKVAGYDD